MHRTFANFTEVEAERCLFIGACLFPDLGFLLFKGGLHLIKVLVMGQEGIHEGDRKI